VGRAAQQSLDFVEAVATVTAGRPDDAQLPPVRPLGDGLGGDVKHRSHLSGAEQLAVGEVRSWGHRFTLRPDTRCLHKQACGNPRGMSEPSKDDKTVVPDRGDDERENREQIEKTGEPKTDKLGNADGAS
jgi:hypothetical protein